jgi:hypothetical protein
MPDEISDQLREAVFEVIKNQINSNEPPETSETLERLMGIDISEWEAMNLIGTVVVSEIFEVLGQGRAFDREKYIAALQNLPDYPWDSGMGYER